MVAAAASGEKVTFHDTVTGLPLFTAPRGRSWAEFIAESKDHGWPSFRDDEVHLEHVRILPDGEAVSIDGTVTHAAAARRSIRPPPVPVCARLIKVSYRSTSGTTCRMQPVTATASTWSRWLGNLPLGRPTSDRGS